MTLNNENGAFPETKGGAEQGDRRLHAEQRLQRHPRRLQTGNGYAGRRR